MTWIGTATALLLLAGQVQAATLYAWEPEGDGTYIVDTAGPALTFVGKAPAVDRAPEIELGQDVLYASERQFPFESYMVNP